MESDVLTNSEQLMKIVGKWDITFSIENGAIAWHCKQKAAYKFLVVDGRLVIGAVIGHIELYATWKLRNEPVDEDIETRFKAIVDKQWGKRNWAIQAAGNVDANGTITSWKSEGFRVETPENMRPAIQEEIVRLYHEGSLTPR